MVEPQSGRNKALVAEALGVSGRVLVQHLVAVPDWEVIGLSRRKPEFETPARYVAIDLLNRADVDRVIGETGDVSHIFYAALQPRDNFFDEVAPNLAMLRNLVEAAEAVVETLAEDRTAGRGEVVRCRFWPIQDAGQRGRPAAHAAQFLLRPAGLPRRAISGQSLVVVGPASLEGSAVLPSAIR